MFETLLQSNRNLGTKSENFLLIDLPLLTGKLPDDLRLRIARIFDNDICEISEIFYFVKIELELKQRSSFILPHTSLGAVIRRCSSKQVFLEISQILQENTSARVCF